MKNLFPMMCAVLALGLLNARQAEAIVFTSSGSGLSASATFTFTPNNTLTILLSNTDAKTDAISPSQVLTGIFFNLGTAAFSKVSATLPTGSSIIQIGNCDVTCAGATNVGGEWGYAVAGSGFDVAVTGATQGISSAGYIGSTSTLFGGQNYDGPMNGALNGVEFGIVPLGWTEGNGNGGVVSSALIQGSVEFVLGNIPAGLTEAMIKNVYFTYGTAYGERTLIGTTGGISVPEPGALSLIGLGAAYLVARRRRTHT